MLLCLLLAWAVYAEQITLYLVETDTRDYFNNWKDDPYVRGSHDCSDMTVEVEEYMETHHGYDTYFVYGNRYNETGSRIYHMWILVNINDVFYEFESTVLCFKTVSSEYNVHCVQHGFFQDGKEVNYSVTIDKEVWEKWI